MGFVMGSIVNQDPSQFGQAAANAGQNPGMPFVHHLGDPTVEILQYHSKLKSSRRTTQTLYKSVMRCRNIPCNKAIMQLITKV